MLFKSVRITRNNASSAKIGIDIFYSEYSLNNLDEK